MRVTLHSALAISTCALALLSQLPSVHSILGDFDENGNYPINTFAQEYVMAYQKELGLSDIRWCGGNKYELRLARVIWNNQIAFMKCDRASIEIRAFNALKNMKEGLDTMDLKKKLDPVYAIGRQNVMDPLHQFEFYEENRTRYFCYLYSYIDGTVLPEYFKKHTISHAFITAAKILPEVIKGAIYLYNAGIIHEDLYPKNIMIQLTPTGEIAGVKIIDLDATEVFRKEQDWQPINPNTNEYLSPNPRQYHKSCDEFKETIVKFLNVFLLLEKEGNPFDPKYVLAEQATQNCLGKFKQGLRYAEVELGDLNAASRAIHYFLKAYYTMWYDNFSCSSPMRALKGLPPRTGSS